LRSLQTGEEAMTSPRKSAVTTLGLSMAMALAFFSLSVAVLLLYSGLDAVRDFRAQESDIFNKQQLAAQNAAKTVSNFINENFSVLETAIGLSPFDRMSGTEQKQVLQTLVGLRPAFRHLVLFDDRNDVVAQASRLSSYASKAFVDRLKESLPGKNPPVERTIGPVHVNPATSEPMAIMALPVKSVLGDIQGTLIVELNLKFMWDIVDRLKVGETGYVYVADRKGNLLAFSDSGRVLKGESVEQLEAVAEFIRKGTSAGPVLATTYRGILGSTVVGTYAPLTTPDWAVIAELPWEEAYRELLLGIVTSMGITLAMAVLAGFFGVFAARRFASPLIDLTVTASRIAGGERDLQAEVAGPREVAHLATAFNSMTAQLRQSLQDLQKQFDELKRTEEAYRRSEERLRLAVEGTSDGIWDWDVRTGHTYFSPSYYTMMGYEPDEFPASYQNWLQRVHPDDVEEAVRLAQRAIAESSSFVIEFRFKTKNGEWRWVCGRGKAAGWDADGNTTRMAGFHSDITERKLAEQQTRAALEEKEVLLREVHHRVKNNLQAIIYLIRSEADQCEDKRGSRFLGELEERARTMALVYEQLYQSENLARIEMVQYLSDLASNLAQAFGAERDIPIGVESGKIWLDVEIGMPCGLIVNELVTNALKHAFPPGTQDRGRISVALRKEHERYVLRVSDNGVGLPPGLPWREARSLGLRLVNLWATHQLGGTIAVEGPPGTAFVVTFPARRGRATSDGHC